MAHPSFTQSVEGLCVALDARGDGLVCIPAGLESLRLHIAGALPGERVRARVEHVSEHVRDGVREAWAELSTIVEALPERVAPICGAFGSCSACTLMSLAYPAQLRHKRERVAALLAERPELADVAVQACVPSPRTEGYRNQAKFVFGREHASGEPVLGAYGRRSHRIVNLAACRVVEPNLEKARAVLLAILLAMKVEPFDELRRTGILRYVLLRATRSGEVLATLVAARRDWKQAQDVAAALAHELPSVVGVVLNVNASHGNALLGEEEHLLLGRASVEDCIGDVSVRLSSRSFFQVNRDIATQIYRDVVAFAPPRMDRAVDVYAGAAGFALSLVDRCSEVVAVEENPAATAAAAAFIAEGPAAGKIRVITGDAGRCLTGIASADFVVLNPPRKGCAEQVLAEVLRLAPRRIAYVSCDPETMSRDLAFLVRAGATVTNVVPYDMMPHTPHVETCASVSMSSIRGKRHCEAGPRAAHTPGAG